MFQTKNNSDVFEYMEKSKMKMKMIYIESDIYGQYIIVKVIPQ